MKTHMQSCRHQTQLPVCGLTSNVMNTVVLPVRVTEPQHQPVPSQAQRQAPQVQQQLEQRPHPRAGTTEEVREHNLKEWHGSPSK